MTAKRNEQAQATDRLSELLAEELTSLTGRELEEAARAWGVDPSKSADHVDDAFRAAIKLRNQERLRAAKQSRNREVEKLSSTKPSTCVDRAALLATLTERLEELQRDNANRVTIQHRNLTELSDGDLVSLLGQLSALERK